MACITLATAAVGALAVVFVLNVVLGVQNDAVLIPIFLLYVAAGLVSTGLGLSVLVIALVRRRAKRDARTAAIGVTLVWLPVFLLFVFGQ